ncbi:MAG: PIN domain-containing protein [Chloroflexi bacterium]|nr:PIN domain-containing protein [Chloroflexota bacterium]
MRFLDTNIILRYLTRDDEEKAAACFQLFQRLKNGEEEAMVSEAVITEVAYVLSARAHYGLSPEEIRVRLVPILSLRGLKLRQKRLYLRALDIYSSHPFLDFEDALSAAYMEANGITEILSYDTDFDRVAGLERREP